MMSDTNARRYSTGAMVFHWVIAVLVIANWQIAERAEALQWMFFEQSKLEPFISPARFFSYIFIEFT